MAKFYGIVGYAEEVEVRPGVWKKVTERRPYYGDVLDSTRRLDGQDQINDGLNVANRFNLLVDEYAWEHISALVYLEWQGVKWKITSVEVKRPRLILKVGGVYHETA